MLVALWGAMHSVCAAQSGADLSGVVPIHLVRGVNSVSDFDGDGHPAKIVYAWRENMNAHGYGIYSVLMQRPGKANDWTLVTFDIHDMKRPGGSELDALRDEPFDGEQAVASVRFVKGQWKGERATLAITARRDLAHASSFIDAAPVQFDIYRLVANRERIVGWPFYYFDLIAEFESDKPYCNSDWALMKALNLSLPENYQGPRAEGGCIP